MSLEYQLIMEPAKPIWGYMSCQSCGEQVYVQLPFYGCVFCSECIGGESFETADAAEFKPKIPYK